MKLKIVIFVCGLFLQRMNAEQKCDVNDIRTLLIHLNQLGLELQEYKERTSSLEKQFEETNVANKAKANDLNSTLQTGLLKVGEAINKLTASLENQTEDQKTLKERTSSMEKKLEEINDANKAKANDLNSTIQTGLINVGEAINKLTLSVENQTEDQKTLKDRTSSLEKKVEEMSEANKAHGNDLNSTLQTGLLYVEEVVNKLTVSLENTTEDLKILKFNVSALQLDSVRLDRAVGFVATSGNHAPCSGTLRFERSIVNRGNAYNTYNGYFTAPYSAMYQFTVQMCLHQNTKALYKITSPTRGVFIQTHYQEQFEDSCSSVSTVGYLSQGEHVYVECRSVGDLEGTQDGDYWTMFSGALLQ